MRKSILMLLLGFTAFSSQASITVSNCFITEPTPGSNVSGLFFDVKFIHSEEINALRLPSPEMIQGASVDELGGLIEIHDTIIQDGVMVMQPIPYLPVFPGTTLPFRKGGLHMMIKDMTKRPIVGEQYPVKIWLAYLGEPTCIATVVKPQDAPKMTKQMAEAMKAASGKGQE